MFQFIFSKHTAIVVQRIVLWSKRCMFLSCLQPVNIFTKEQCQGKRVSVEEGISRGGYQWRRVSVEEGISGGGYQ